MEATRSREKIRKQGIHLLIDGIVNCIVLVACFMASIIGLLISVLYCSNFILNFIKGNLMMIHTKYSVYRIVKIKCIKSY